MLTTIERLRFYLRDPEGTGQFFSDAELSELEAYTSSFEEAVGLGWLVRATATATASTSSVASKTIGKVTKTYSGSESGTSVNTAFELSRYWFGKANVNVARWFEYVPHEDTGIIGELHKQIDALRSDPDYDLSRLIAIGW